MLRPVIGLVTGMEAVVGGRNRSFGKQHYFEKHPPQEMSPGERRLFSNKRKEAVSIAQKGSEKSRNSSLDTSTQMPQVHVSGPHSFSNMVLTLV